MFAALLSVCRKDWSLSACSVRCLYVIALLFSLFYITCSPPPERPGTALIQLQRYLDHQSYDSVYALFSRPVREEIITEMTTIYTQEYVRDTLWFEHDIEPNTIDAMTPAEKFGALLIFSEDRHEWPPLFEMVRTNTITDIYTNAGTAMVCLQHAGTIELVHEDTAWKINTSPFE